MLEKKSFITYKKGELYDQLLSSIKGTQFGTAGKGFHVIPKRFDEPEEEAKARYLEETGYFIGGEEIIVFINKFDDLPEDTPGGYQDDTQKSGTESTREIKRLKCNSLLLQTS